MFQRRKIAICKRLCRQAMPFGWQYHDNWCKTIYRLTHAFSRPQSIEKRTTSEDKLKMIENNADDKLHLNASSVHCELNHKTMHNLPMKLCHIDCVHCESCVQNHLSVELD